MPVKLNKTKEDQEWCKAQNETTIKTGCNITFDFRSITRTFLGN